MPEAAHNPNRTADLLLTALAPMIWGSSYIVASQLLPDFSPLTVAMLRALPAGLLLLLLSRQLPQGLWWARILLLGALNFSIFWSLLFVSAYRLPGGVAATVGALQPLLVVLLAAPLLGQPLRLRSLLAAVGGLTGVALLVLKADARLDPLGLLAGLGAAASMALGTVLSRRWQPPVPLLSFTAWQLTAGGLLLVPIVWLFAPTTPALTTSSLLGLGWLCLIGAALSYLLFLRGLARIDTAIVASLGFLSPITAVILGWLLLGERLSPWQMAGAALVLLSIGWGQRSVSAHRKAAPIER